MPTHEIIATDWMYSLSDQIHELATEGIFNSRWLLLETYHGIGRLILDNENYKRYSHGNGRILTDLSELCGVHERDLRRSIQFVTKYPDINTLPDGKNISWNKVITKLLPDAPPEEKPEPVTREQLIEAIKDAHEAMHNEYMDCAWCSGRVGHENERHDSDCIWLKIAPPADRP